jgi:hypothetical protein
MLAMLTAAGQVFEAGMLVCFGVAWPVDIYKTLRTRETRGKSARFMSLIFLGYLSGIAAKVIRADGGLPEAVTWLYALNALLVGLDIALCLHYRPRGPGESEI